jgi:hypothetical protein
MRRLVRLIVILIVLLGGYWAYFVFAAADPNDRFGVAMTSYLPEPAREFACRKLKERFGDIQTPHGCAEFAFWGSAPAASGTPDPAEAEPGEDPPETEAP